jgi:hypothetical protein
VGLQTEMHDCAGLFLTTAVAFGAAPCLVSAMLCVLQVISRRSAETLHGVATRGSGTSAL